MLHKDKLIHLTAYLIMSNMMIQFISADDGTYFY